MNLGCKCPRKRARWAQSTWCTDLISATLCSNVVHQSLEPKFSGSSIIDFGWFTRQMTANPFFGFLNLWNPTNSGPSPRETITANLSFVELPGSILKAHIHWDISETPRINCVYIYIYKHTIIMCVMYVYIYICEMYIYIYIWYILFSWPHKDLTKKRTGDRFLKGDKEICAP